MTTEPIVYVVDDDIIIREALTALLENEGFKVESCASAQEFLESYRSGQSACVLLDIDLPGIDGLELQEYLLERDLQLPIIFLTGQANVPKTIQAFKNRAFDFLEKPATDKVLLECIHKALAQQASDLAERERRASVEQRMNLLTPREKDVFSLLAMGHSNRQIGDELNISTRTVEGHRRRVYEKMQADSFASLIEMAYVVGVLNTDMASQR